MARRYKDPTSVAIVQEAEGTAPSGHDARAKVAWAADFATQDAHPEATEEEALTSLVTADYTFRLQPEKVARVHVRIRRAGKWSPRIIEPESL